MLRIAFMVSIFVFSFMSKNHAVSKKDAYLVRAAIGFALVADIFLVVNETHYIYAYGVVSFCICQLLHFYRFAGKKALYRLLPLLPAVFIALSFYISDIVVRTSAVYIVCLFGACGGAVYAYKTKKYDAPNRYFIVMAMALFVVSDIAVLCYNAPELLGYRLYSLYVIWIFCLPAHILMSLSKIKLK